MILAQVETPVAVELLLVVVEMPVAVELLLVVVEMPVAVELLLVVVEMPVAVELLLVVVEMPVAVELLLVVVEMPVAVELLLVVVEMPVAVELLLVVVEMPVAVEPLLVVVEIPVAVETTAVETTAVETAAVETAAVETAAVGAESRTEDPIAMNIDPNFGLRVTLRDTIWEKHVDWALSELQSCKNSDGPHASPCNVFVGEALEKVYGVPDFRAKVGYLDANEMDTYMILHSPPWKNLGYCDNQDALSEAQNMANARVAVVAARSDTPNGHVAIVIPGDLSFSSHWSLNVPNSACFFLDHPNSSYIGARLSQAWKAQYISEIKLFARIS
jgi:hypothetical protein